MPIVKWLVLRHLETNKKINFINITVYFVHCWFFFSSILLNKAVVSGRVYFLFFFHIQRHFIFILRGTGVTYTVIFTYTFLICKWQWILSVFHAILLWQAHTFPELAKAGNHAKNLGNPQPLGRSPRDLREWRVDLPISFGLLRSPPPPPPAWTSCSCCSQLAIPPTHQTI